MIDQQFAGPFEGGDLCCERIGRGTLPIGQSFTPTQRVIVGVELNLQNITLGTKRLQIILRQGDITGPPVSFSTADVPFTGIFTGPSSARWIHFDFPCPAVVTPGATYTIQLVQDNGGNDILWSTKTGNPYLRGTAFRTGSAFPADYGFRTYYLPEATSALVTLNTVTAPPSVTRGTPFPVTVNYSLLLAPTGAFVGGFFVTASGVTNSGSLLGTYHADSCQVQAGTFPTSFTMTLPTSFPTGPNKILVEVGVSRFNIAQSAITVVVN
jgi:hypothetical protein